VNSRREKKIGDLVVYIIWELGERERKWLQRKGKRSKKGLSYQQLKETRWEKEPGHQIGVGTKGIPRGI